MTAEGQGPSRWAWAVAVSGAVVAGAAAITWFATREPMPVLVGFEPLDQTVPAHYQASVFPAFGAMLAVSFFHAMRGAGRDQWLPRVLVIVLTSVLSVIRLAGLLPLSGHALFLSAALVLDSLTPSIRRSRLLWLLAAPSFALTAYYKLAVWHDTGWFAASCCAGALIGWSANRLGGGAKPAT